MNIAVAARRNDMIKWDRSWFMEQMEFWSSAGALSHNGQFQNHCHHNPNHMYSHTHT